jgi:hypothetical protein
MSMLSGALAILFMSFHLFSWIVTWSSLNVAERPFLWACSRADVLRVIAEATEDGLSRRE